MSIQPPSAPSVTIDPRLPALAGWLGLLLVMVITLNSLGGWVRLSGSGVAIPSWPAIPLGEGRWTLWPPLSQQGWAEVHGAYLVDQARLQARVATGELHATNLGRVPRDGGEFRLMFLTEWSHRLLAALVGIVTAVCLFTALRRAPLRAMVCLPLGIASALIVLQAVIGGLLVSEGTSTNWLFLHQGNAGAILVFLTWSCLVLVAQAAPRPEATVMFRRRRARLVVGLALISTWIQMVLGALLAGSRHGQPFSNEFPLIFGSVVPAGLWQTGQGLYANILDNSLLHQFVHRWAGVVVGLVCLIGWRLAVVAGAGERARLALAVTATFLGCEMILGIGNVVLTDADGHGPPALALAHQLGAGCMITTLTMAWFWLRRESDAPMSQATQDLPATGATA